MPRYPWAFVWAMIWTAIPTILLTWSNIPVKLLTWTVNPEQTNELFDRSLIIWLLTCTVNPERTFAFCNPVTFVWLRNERFPAYVFRDSVCFELSVHMNTCFRSRIWTIYFRNPAFVLVSELTSGVSDFTFAVEFASEALPSYMIPIYFRGGIWPICFRGFAFVRVSDWTSQWNLSYALPMQWLRSFSDTVLLLRSCLCFWTLALSRTSQILGKRTIPHSNFSERKQ